MPRTSAEERAASFYRASRTPLVPPLKLSAACKAAWGQIVNAKPVDWFDNAQTGLLTEYCRSQVETDVIWARLKGLPPGSKERAALFNELKIVRNGMMSLASALRLTVQHTIDSRAAKSGEKQSGYAALVAEYERRVA